MLITCNACYKSFDDFEASMLSLGSSFTALDSIEIDEHYPDLFEFKGDEWHCGMSFEDYGLDIYCHENTLRILCDDEQRAITVWMMLRGVAFIGSGCPAADGTPVYEFKVSKQRMAV